MLTVEDMYYHRMPKVVHNLHTTPDKESTVYSQLSMCGSPMHILLG